MFTSRSMVVSQIKDCMPVHVWIYGGQSDQEVISPVTGHNVNPPFYLHKETITDALLQIYWHCFDEARRWWLGGACLMSEGG